ncbi:MAG TPA: LysE family transporter [Actinomycetota bacterium]|nr:LysE family transporter [Actinomycetota bacterium]
MSSFLEGALAGYGIAIPVGAIGVLLVDLAMRRGFLPAAAAATGAATADFLYALVAMVLGAAVAEAVESFQDTLRIVSAVVLLGVAAILLRSALRSRAPATESAGPAEAGLLATYARFVGLTILNPATITYFVALIVGLDRGDASAADKTLFVAGAFLASWSWQLWLAAMGAFLHKRIPESVRWVFGAAGSLVVAGFAVRLIVAG